MRNLQKIFHVLFVWGMVPLIVWSGCPTVGCACAATAQPVSSCGCCTQENAQTEKSCCCRAKKHSKNAASAAVSPRIPTIDLGLVTCGCERSVSSASASIKEERKPVGEDLISQVADASAIKPDRPIAKPVAGSSVSRTDCDRVILYCALLI